MNSQTTSLGRLVLLSPSGKVDTALAILPLTDLVARAREEATRHPGRIVGGEWLDREGQWQRSFQIVA